MTTPVTLGAGYFNGMYEAAADPWGFQDRWYERRKYAISLALLPAERYRVLSEILYYFGDHDLEQVLKHAAASLEPDGTLLAVHWRHPVAEYPRTGDDVHQVLAAHPGLGLLARHAEPDFLAEVYIRTAGTPASVAQATGLV